MTRTRSVTVTTVVDADPATAFRLFTDEVDLWWRPGPKFRPAVHGAGVLRFEPHVGGRLLEIYEDGSSFHFGNVQHWEPGARLVFDLIGRDFLPGESTQVEVRFDAEGARTRVTVEHRGWERFRDSHPVRHGLSEPAFLDVMGAWWADLLVAVQNHVSSRTASNPS